MGNSFSITGLVLNSLSKIETEVGNEGAAFSSAIGGAVDDLGEDVESAFTGNNKYITLLAIGVGIAAVTLAAAPIAVTAFAVTDLMISALEGLGILAVSTTTVMATVTATNFGIIVTAITAALAENGVQQYVTNSVNDSVAIQNFFSMIYNNVLSSYNGNSSISMASVPTKSFSISWHTWCLNGI